jgi:translocation and assembly module TamB
MVEGILITDVHVGGTPDAPRVEGFIGVDKGAFTLPPTGVRYQALTLDLQLDGEGLRVERLHMLDENNHALEGSGRLGLEGRRVSEIDLTLVGYEFEVLDNEWGELSIDSSINVLGTPLSPRIVGLVRLDDGRVQADALLERLTSNAYATKPTTIDEGVEPEPVGGPSYDLTIEIPDNLIVRGNDIRPADAALALGDLNITVGGSFTLRKEGAQDALMVGIMRTIRGTYSFQGREFVVLRDGTVAFRGSKPIDPALDIRAERVISGIVAHVDIDGSMRKPAVALSSRPPLDEADILSLIIFNQPMDQLGEGQRASLGDRAAGLASGLIVSPISESLERAFDVSLFEIEAISDEGGGPALTVGEQINERLFMRFRQAFGAWDATEFELEYQFSDFLRLQGSLADGHGRASRSVMRRVERGGIDFIVFLSF